MTLKKKVDGAEWEETLVEIISKRDGPRREDVEAKRLIAQNRGTITRLADQISGGQYSASRMKKSEPRAEGLIIHSYGGTSAAEEPKPYIRISPNDRVVMVDENTAKQMHHIGEIRRLNGFRTFVLATKANGFFAPVDEIVSEALLDLDGTHLNGREAEAQLAVKIGEKLGL